MWVQNPRCLAVYKAHKRSHVNAIKLDSAWMFSSSDDGTVKQRGCYEYIVLKGNEHGNTLLVTRLVSI